MPGDSPEACADRVAGEVARLLDGATVRDRGAGTVRRAAPSDVAILFRSRDTHREFQAALESRQIPACVYKGLGFFDADEIKDCRALLRFLADPASELRAAALLRSRLVGLSDRALAALSGRLAESLRPAGPEPRLERVDPLDRDLLLRLRASAARWLAAVDRVPPAELVDRVLADCAYAFELRGPRLVQARENLKKLRGLVRRVQNRGFATLARIAEHVDRLSGDVSNAVVDAFDAVNLMTVHAAKGLEFPVVFLVELARGAGGPPPPIRVVADRGDGEPSVSVAPFRSAADRDQRGRELEETKRLLYVAATRARDRLYLSATLTGGAIRAGAGSLAAVVPPGLLAQLAAGAADGRRASWTGPSGRAHAFAVVEPETVGASFRPPGAPAPAGPDRFEPWRPSGSVLRVSVTSLAGGGAAAGAPPVGATTLVGGGAAAGAPQRTRGVDPVVGRLVHRLLRDDGEAAGFGSGPSDVCDRVVGLMDREERARADYLGLADEAVGIYRRAVRRADVAALLDGECLFEVPFTLRRGGDPGGAGGPVFVRGAIDCLRRWPDGRVTVIEVKTGAPRPEHEAQLALYLEAARALFRGRRVDGRLLYLT